MCCISLRSAVYFGASIHVFMGTFYFGIFLMKVALYLKHTLSSRPEEPSLTLLTFLILLMGACFLPLGCLIFRGIDKEKVGLIKIPLVLTVLAKIVETSLRLVQGTIYRNPKSERKVDWEERTYQVLDPTLSTLYFLLLFFYTREMIRRKRLSAHESVMSDYFKPPHLKRPDLTITASLNAKPLMKSQEL